MACPDNTVQYAASQPRHPLFINYTQTASLNSRVVQHYMLYIYI
eukprot:COSAG01_NODE_50499_length_363_cov_0.530303_1_plen_43_part_10